MQFHSTNNRSIRVSLEEAVMHGLAPDGGLYMPTAIPELPGTFFQDISRKSFAEISYDVAHNFLGGDLHEEELRKIVGHTIQFDAPVVEVEKNIFSLELFHGPTLAFKDFGARFLSGLLSYFANLQGKEITILVATSGDTGSAVANGFLNVPGTSVIVLYPSGMVSPLQEKQFTTLGGNITALEVAGTFDDCQRMVKEAFLSDELKKKFVLTSANSINIARLLPQSFYYFYAYAQLKDRRREINFSVPSGNFGNLTAGLMAKKMGLPAGRFIAATNINNVVPEYLKSGSFLPRASRQTISNAMDVGNPSNFGRMLDLYDNDRRELSKNIFGCAFTDDETRKALRELAEGGYVADPHGAVAYLGLKKYLAEKQSDTIGVFFETAHPGKFGEVVEQAINQKLELPARLEKFVLAKKISIPLSNRFEDFKDYLISRPR
jgi:threonine synthase